MALEQTEDPESRALMPYAFLRKSMRLLDAIDTLARVIWVKRLKY